MSTRRTALPSDLRHLGAAIALVAAFLNAVFDVSIGCLMYVWLVRASVFRPRRSAA